MANLALVGPCTWTTARLAHRPSSSSTLHRLAHRLVHTPLLHRSVRVAAAAPNDNYFSLGIQHTPVQTDQHVAQKMEEWILEIKKMFRSMSLGEISVSPYDTAWVAMVPALNGSNAPQFPKSLDWIIDNQLLDGSWGDKQLFLAYDRVLNTIACVVALKTWNIGHDNVQKGVEFIHRNIKKIKEEADDYMPIAFEVVFPTMLDDAKELGIDLPYDSPVLVKIRKERERKLNKISMELLHTYPTTLLHSLEGIHRLVDWRRLLKLQTKGGSFLFSPACTACALKYTGDLGCLNYLNMVLNKFDNAVPGVYPVDLFEHIWMVDRLERLGISRYFKKEIKESLDYVYKYWTPRGIAWAKESNVFDVDDTAMGFRLLRLHGYHVCPDVFLKFKKNKEFICFEGQTSQSITGLHNLYRASELMLPNESILEEAQLFTKSFLIDKKNQNKLEDKWVISKGLKDEVTYTLEYPWAESLPRIEARNFINHYGVDDAWIAKSLYRMANVNNETFLKLAREDYNLCQSFHKKELAHVLRWNEECQFGKLSFACVKATKLCFFSAAATLFEPEYSLARIVWACCCFLTLVIDDFFDEKGSMEELADFVHAIDCWDPIKAKDFSEEMKIVFYGLYNTLNMINQEAFKAQGRDISFYLRGVWVRYLKASYTEANWKFLNHLPTLEEYINIAKYTVALEPVLEPTLFFLGEKIFEQDLKCKDHLHMMDLVDTIGRLNNDIQTFEKELNKEGKWSSISIYLKENPKASKVEAIHYFKKKSEDAMKDLVKEYLQDTIVSRKCKQITLNMAKVLNLFYRNTDGCRSMSVMDQHVKNTLHEPIP